MITPPGGWSASVSRLGLAGSLLAFATTGIYLAIILSEGNNGFGEFGPWAVTFSLIGVSAVAASVVPWLRWRAPVFAAAAGVSTAVGLLALWSIGVLLLAAAAVLIAAAADATAAVREEEGRSGGFAAAVAVVSFTVAIAVAVVLL